MNKTFRGTPSLEGQWRYHASQYLDKHRFASNQITSAPDPDLHLIVVIPAYDEPDLLQMLQGLLKLSGPRCAVEIIVVLNDAEADTASLRARHLAQYIHLGDEMRHARFPVHITYYPCLPKRHAGVGLARKLGLDEGLARFLAVNNLNGLLVCLDADCQCEENYFVALETHFASLPDTAAANIYFEHPLSSHPPIMPLNPVDEGILKYELFLRYHVLGLRFSGAPHAFQTMGSCMAVRAIDYARQGGMNRRQGGEDFYFLQKYFRLGTFSEVRNTTVMPSARVSSRAPFGTGHALQHWLETNDSKAYPVYAPACYQVLRDCYSAFEHIGIETNRRAGELLLSDGLLGDYLRQTGFFLRLEEVRQNVASDRAFQKRIRRWFDGIRVLKAIHWLTENHYPKEPVISSALTLLHWLKETAISVPVAPRHLLVGDLSASDLYPLLLRYRQLERAGWLSPAINTPQERKGKQKTRSRL